MSGVKIDQSHFGCVYNIGCCHYFVGEYANAKKWFDLAIKVNCQSIDSFFGKAVCCLKLGQYKEALEAISTVDRESWEGIADKSGKISENYFWHQITYLHAICLKINKRFDEA